MRTELKKMRKIENFFFKLMSNKVFRKTMENVTEHRDIKFLTTEARRNYLMSEPSYHTTNIFAENLLAIEKNTNVNE